VATLKEEEHKKKPKICRKSTIFAGVQYLNEMSEEDKNHTYLRYDFCQDLLMNKPLIKSKALDFTTMLIKILHVRFIFIFVT